MMQMLIQAGADINAQDLGGRTPLYVAAKYNSLDTVGILLANKANTFQASKRKLNAIDVTTDLGIFNMINKGKMVSVMKLLSSFKQF